MVVAVVGTEQALRNAGHALCDVPSTRAPLDTEERTNEGSLLIADGKAIMDDCIWLQR